MDKLLIRAADACPAKSPFRREERRAADSVPACCRRSRCVFERAASQRHFDDAAPDRADGRRSDDGRQRRPDSRQPAQQSGCAVRHGQDHARVDPRAQAAGRPLWRGQVSLPGGCAIGARRSTSTSRACRRWAPKSCRAGLRPCKASRLKGARIVTDMVTRDRHRKPDDGRRAGRRRDDDRKRRARARGRRSGQLPDRHGRADHRCWNRQHPDRQASIACTARALDHARPHRDREPICARRRRPAAMLRLTNTSAATLMVR